MALGPWTDVVSFHTYAETCGVARFSAQLAHRLGVPLRSLDEPPTWGARPLLSLKWAELEWPLGVDIEPYDQLWHDEPPPQHQECWGRVWKLYDIGVPAIVERVSMTANSGLTFFTFGMAHKLELGLFLKLRQHTPSGTHLWISTAAHEGAGPSRVNDLLGLWGPGARDLGHLSDAALELVWPRIWASGAFVAFFAGGLRANNSSVHAALNAGCPVITNHGDHTPADLRAVTMDLETTGWLVWLTQVRRRAKSPYTWDRLLKELLCAPPPYSTETSTTAPPPL